MKGPNPALALLEADLDYTCQPLDTFPWGDGLRVTRYQGVRFSTNYSRPMIGIFTDTPDTPLHHSKQMAYAEKPCAPCLDFSRSWNCPDHPERGLEESIRDPSDDPFIEEA